MKSKLSREQWKLAKILFEAGEPLKVIESKVDINRGSISRRAKNEGWEKGRLQPMIEQAIQVEQAKDELTATQRHVVEDLIDEKVQNTRLIHNLTKLNLKDVTDKLKLGLDSISDNKLAQDAIDKASITLGVNPRFSNTHVDINAENSVNEIRIIRDED